MRAVFSLFACSWVWAQPAVAQEIPGPVPAEILHIVDGDTVGVRAHTWPGQYVEIRVRLRGADAPEIRRVDCEAERAKGHEATEFTRAWLSAPGGEGFAPVMLTEIGPDSFWGRVVARLVRAAIEYAINHGRKSVTLVHKGNIMKYTEGAFRDWGYETAKEEFGAVEMDGGPWCRLPGGLIIKDAIADITLQQVLTRPEDFDVIATLNLNGDYLSDALAAQVGGIGIAPGGNINYVTGHAIFEATHGTAPKYANQDVVNPGSVILSGEMMLRHLGWNEAADLIISGLNHTISSKRVTYDFARLMDGATKIKCSEFADEIIARIAA